MSQRIAVQSSAPDPIRYAQADAAGPWATQQLLTTAVCSSKRLVLMDLRVSQRPRLWSAEAVTSEELGEETAPETEPQVAGIQWHSVIANLCPDRML